VVVLGALLGIAVIDATEGVALARVALIAAGVVNLVVEGIKRGTERVRPDGDRNPANSSFPSSHAANAFALAALLARRWRRGAAAFWIGAAVIAVSRVYLNRHFASDVLVGAVLGGGLALATARVMRWRVAQPRGGAAQTAPPSPEGGI
jgi:undecaprenyl-diphosphatase